MSLSIEEIQGPVKKKLLASPERAAALISASAELSGRLKYRVSTEGLEYEAGLHPAVGGEPGTLCPGTVYLSSLCACAGVTLSAVAEYMGIAIKRCSVSATGSLDLRGTLGLSEDVPVGFTEIRITVDIDADTDETGLAELLKMTEKFSVNNRTVTDTAEIIYLFR